MRNLLDFLIKYNYWFLFLLLETICFLLLFRFNNYQKGVFFTSANVVAGKVYEVSGGVVSYFHLKAVNEALLDRNVMLEQQIVSLENALKAHVVDSAEIARIKESPVGEYEVFKANVINNSISRTDNYITIDKGELDGIRPDMGVLDANGVVGIVYMTSSHYSVVISLLNSKSSINCKILGRDYSGSLSWEHGDSRYAFLNDLPRHATVTKGDTVVTSGYSTVFPPGMMVGTIDEISDSNDGLSYLLSVKLAADFSRLTTVRLFSKNGQKEQLDLEKSLNPKHYSPKKWQ